MKSNELRVGNYIQNDSGIKCLASIHCDNTIRTFNEEKSDTIGCFFLSHFEPIPLTKEWIDACGFKYNSYRHFFEHKSNRIIEYDSYKKKFIFYLVEYGDWFMPIEYVHELQNLYFALTGEELTIATSGS